MKLNIFTLPNYIYNRDLFETIDGSRIYNLLNNDVDFYINELGNILIKEDEIVKKDFFNNPFISRKDKSLLKGILVDYCQYVNTYNYNYINENKYQFDTKNDYLLFFKINNDFYFQILLHFVGLGFFSCEHNVKCFKLKLKYNDLIKLGIYHIDDYFAYNEKNKRNLFFDITYNNVLPGIVNNIFFRKTQYDFLYNVDYFHIVMEVYVCVETEPGCDIEEIRFQFRNEKSSDYSYRIMEKCDFKEVHKYNNDNKLISIEVNKIKAIRLNKQKKRTLRYWYGDNINIINLIKNKRK